MIVDIYLYLGNIFLYTITDMVKQSFETNIQKLKVYSLNYDTYWVYK